jgi:hypothetical protein
MKRHLLSVAAAALLAGTGFVNAQSISPGSTGSQSGQSPTTPPAAGAAPSAAQRGIDPPQAPGSQSGAAPRDSNGQRAQDAPGQKSGTTSSDRQPGMDKGGAEDRGNRNADSKSGADQRATTTGQAGAAGKLSTDQRSKITTVIKQQRVQPATNINFSISVGTRVPRDVRFYPLPAEIVTIYPDWRGYEFFRVGDEIVVVDPRSLEIVAVLDA